MQSRAFTFLKPTFVAVGAFVLFVAIGHFRTAAKSEQADDSQLETWPPHAETTANPIDANPIELTSTNTEPHPSLAPTDIVRIQLQSLASVDFDQGVQRCFAFASPANRQLTGPAERFGKLVQNPPYSIVLSAEDTIVGDPMLLQDGRVQVIVTVISQLEAQSFAWTLAKQTAEPYRNCWMTDSVVAISKETSGSDRIDV